MANTAQQSSAFDMLHPVETKRASEAIYEQVKELILTGDLKPGDRLPSERNMMELFRRSRPTIREALRMLERSGYIRAIAGSNGAVVLEPDDKNLEENMEDALQVGQISLAELSEYRSSSEATTVTWAARRRTDADLEAMEALLREMDGCMDHFEQFVNMDPQFHGLLAKAGKNGVSVVMNRTLSKLNRSFVINKSRSLSPEQLREMAQRISRMHWAIYEAIRARDEERSRQAMEEHLRAFAADLREP